MEHFHDGSQSEKGKIATAQFQILKVVGKESSLVSFVFRQYFLK